LITPILIVTDKKLNKNGNRTGMNPRSHHGKAPGRKPLRGERKKVATASLLPSTIKWLKQEAKNRGISVSELVEELIQIAREVLS